MEPPVPYCRLIDRERRSEAVQTPIGFLTLSADGNRMTARMHLVEDLCDFSQEKNTRRKRAGMLIDACPSAIREHIRDMLTDGQLMGEELGCAAEHFTFLSQETARIYKKEGASERFNEIASLKSGVLGFILTNILVHDHEKDPLLYPFLEMLILKAFRLEDPIKMPTS